MNAIFRVSPVLIVMGSVSGAAGQYGCYAYDGALTLHFGEKTTIGNVTMNNGTSRYDIIVW